MEKSFPEIKSFKPIEFPDYKITHLDNGIPVYQLKSPDQDVLKLEINFRAGRIFEKKHGVARACSHQMKEGTINHSSSTIADVFDYYGTNLQTSAGMDFLRIEFYSLTRYFELLLPYIDDIITNSAFPESELLNYKQRNYERLNIDLSKNDVVSYRELTEKLFSPDHPYGYNSVKETLDAISTLDLVSHYKECINDSIPSIILAGGFAADQLEAINELFGKKSNQIIQAPEYQLPLKTSSQKRFKIKGKQSFQTSIRIGKRIFPRQHPDYPVLYLLNTILGGFFGSRLMKNIREEKGLTYDIYSTIDMMWQDGYLMIGAEVDNDNVGLVLDQIYLEIEKLREKLIGKEELRLVKNYINGNLLNLMNGPFNSIELLRLIAVYGYKIDFFDYFMRSLHEAGPQEIRETAIKYLDKKDFIEVIVGI